MYDRAVKLKGFWPRRVPKARAVHAAGGLGAFWGGGNLAEAAASAASMQFTALYDVSFGTIFSPCDFLLTGFLLNKGFFHKRKWQFS